MKSKKKEVWSDPILDEIHQIRAEMAEELTRNRKTFFKKIHENAKKAGTKYASLKPLSFPLKKQNG